MRINRSLLNWGVFLIALGGVPLAVDQGWIGSDIARDLGQLWPLILVGIGLGLILRWTPFAWFGGALVAATFGVIFGAAVVALPDEDITNLQGIIPAIAVGACSGDGDEPASSSHGGVANGDRFELDVTLSCGELEVTRAVTASWSLEANHDPDDAPNIDDSDLDGATAYLGLSQDGSDDLSMLGRQAHSTWDVEVPAGAALTVATTLNAVDGHIDPGTGQVVGFDGTLNASEVVVDLGAATMGARAKVNLTLNASDARLVLPAGDLAADITLNASSLTVCVPEAAALRVEPSSILSSDDLGSSGLEEANSSLWTSPGFSTAGDHIDLSITSTVSSLSVERPEVCS